MTDMQSKVVEVIGNAKVGVDEKTMKMSQRQMTAWQQYLQFGNKLDVEWPMFTLVVESFVSTKMYNVFHVGAQIRGPTRLRISECFQIIQQTLKTF